MPKYLIVLSKKAQKQLDKFSDIVAQPIFDALNNLQNNLLPVGYKKLKGRNG